jgi:phage FluMu protein Com
MTQGIGVVVRCPVCGWRIFNKVTPTSGEVQVKCPKCRHEVTIDLALRLTRR